MRAGVWLVIVAVLPVAETRGVTAGDRAWPVPAGFGREVAVHVVRQ